MSVYLLSADIWSPGLISCATCNGPHPSPTRLTPRWSWKKWHYATRRDWIFTAGYAAGWQSGHDSGWSSGFDEGLELGPGGRSVGSLQNGLRGPLYTVWAPKWVQVSTCTGFPPKIGTPAPRVYRFSGGKPVQVGTCTHFGAQTVYNGPRRLFCRDPTDHPPGRAQRRSRLRSSDGCAHYGERACRCGVAG